MKYSEFINVYFPFLNKYSELNINEKENDEYYNQKIGEWVLYILEIIENFINTNYKRYGINTLVRVAYNYVINKFIPNSIKDSNMLNDIKNKIYEILSENYKNFDIIYSSDGNIETDLKIIDLYSRDILIYIKRYIELNLGKQEVKILSKQAFRKYYETKLPNELKNSGLFTEIVDLLKILLPQNIYGNFWEYKKV